MEKTGNLPSVPTFPSRLAHEHVGKAVRLCVERGCELWDLPLADLQAIDPAFDRDFHSCLALKQVLAIHDVVGGTAPAQVRLAIARARREAAKLHPEIPMATTI